MKWGWGQTLALLAASLLATWVIWELTEWLLFSLVLIPPLIHWRKR